MSAIWRERVALGISAAVLAVGAGMASAAGNDKEEGGVFHARLTGYQEVPSVSPGARGEFKGKIDPRTGVIDYEFSYEGLQANATQAHIHFGQRGVNGGITVWLCGTSFAATTPGPAGTPTCGARAGSFTGVIDASKVVGPGGAQQLGANELAELIRAMRGGVTYVNVHTEASTGGEIRGQLRHRP